MEIAILVLGVSLMDAWEGGQDREVESAGLVFGSSPASVTVVRVADGPPLTLCIIWTSLLTSQEPWLSQSWKGGQ